MAQQRTTVHDDTHETRFEESPMGRFEGAADLIGVALGLILAVLLLGALMATAT